MFGAPVESTYLWIGLAAVGAVLVGLAVQVPTAPPPDAQLLARTVDSVAASPHEATATHSLGATQVRLGPERVGLRGPGGEAHAAFAYDRIVPALGNDRLTAVLHGRPPEAAFEDRAAFAAALDRARTTDPPWVEAPAALTIRRVTWGEINATLVGR